MTTLSNAEDHGEWLNIRVQMEDGSSTVPVKISREAMEDHFGAGEGGHGLALAYRKHQQVIHTKVLQKMQISVAYNIDHPIELRTADF